jgi:hypothetical protein
VQAPSPHNRGPNNHFHRKTLSACIARTCSNRLRDCSVMWRKSTRFTRRLRHLMTPRWSSRHPLVRTNVNTCTGVFVHLRRGAARVCAGNPTVVCFSDAEEDAHDCWSAEDRVPSHSRSSRVGYNPTTLPQYVAPGNGSGMVVAPDGDAAVITTTSRLDLLDRSTFRCRMCNQGFSSLRLVEVHLLSSCPKRK